MKKYYRVQVLWLHARAEGLVLRCKNGRNGAFLLCPNVQNVASVSLKCGLLHCVIPHFVSQKAIFGSGRVRADALPNLLLENR